MAIDITIPSPGESVTEVTIGQWHRSSGDWVEKDEVIAEVESDKATLEVYAPESGRLEVQAEQGREMSVGDVIGRVDPDASRDGEEQDREKQKAGQAESVEADANEQAALRREAEPAPSASAEGDGQYRATPMARKLAEEKGVALGSVRGTGAGGRITKSDVLAAAESKPEAPEAPAEPAPPEPAPEAGEAPAKVTSVPTAPGEATRRTRRERMTTLRRRIAERLVSAQRTAAMLTTFNEADMTEILRLRRQFKDEFEEKYDVGLGFMSFFVKACTSGLQHYPRLNAYIVDGEIEYHDFVDVSIAVGTEKGLVVPVIRNVEAMTFARIELAVKELADKARRGKLTIEELSGGTFTISNGGVYGSLLSTPILNPPQSGILGMHRIVNRAVEDPRQPGQIALRPMMYLALSYDHRLVDGEQAVRFLVHVRRCLEDPQRLLVGL